MSYKKKVVSIKNSYIKEITYTKKLPVKNKIRNQKLAPTTLAQEEVNNKNAVNVLRLLILENFCEGDWFLTFTYGDLNGQDKEPTPEEAKKHLANFRQKLLRFYKKRGGTVKYIFCTECTPRRHRIHHHALIRVEGVEIRWQDIRAMWQHGWTKQKPFGGTLEDAERLANYMIKKNVNAFFTQPNIFKKRYNASKNLKKPVETSYIIRAKNWLPVPRIPKGYMLDKNSLINGIYSFGENGLDYEYQFYRIIRVDVNSCGTKKRKTVKNKPFKRKSRFTDKATKSYKKSSKTKAVIEADTS